MESDEIESFIGDAVIQLLKQKGVQEYFDNQAPKCPECGHVLKQSKYSGGSSTEDVSGPQHEKVDGMSEFNEIRELLNEVSSWSENEIKCLPPSLSSKARKYKKLHERNF
jgi:hypothetical protein